MLATRQRHLGVGIGPVALSLRNEPFAWHLPQDCQHALIEHIPGAHLLLDHLFAGVCRLHPGLPIGLIATPEKAGEVKGFPGRCQAALRRDMVKYRRGEGLAGICLARQISHWRDKVESEAPAEPSGDPSGKLEKQKMSIAGLLSLFFALIAALLLVLYGLQRRD